MLVEVKEREVRVSGSQPLGRGKGGQCQNQRASLLQDHFTLKIC